MLILTTAESVVWTLEQPPDGLTYRLECYRDLPEGEPIATVFILQPGDRATDLERYRTAPFEHWEFIDKLTGWYEAVFVISDDGFGHVVFVPDCSTSVPEVWTICRANAATANTHLTY